MQYLDVVNVRRQYEFFLFLVALAVGLFVVIVGPITVVLLHCTVDLVCFLRYEVAASTGRTAARLTDTNGVLARVLPNSSTIAL